MSTSAPIIILIAGGTASGKTTLARLLHERLKDDLRLLQLDSYYCSHVGLTAEERANLNFDHPDAFDFQLLLKHVEALRSGESIDVPTYDFATHSRTAHVTAVASGPVIVVEGILALHFAELRALSGLRIFVDTDAALRFDRRLERDVRERGRSPESVVRQWDETAQPMHLLFCEPTKQFADLIVTDTELDDTLDWVVARVRGCAEGS